MDRNIYSKYSLYKQDVKKGKRNFFLLLMFFGLLSLVVFLAKNIKGKTLFEDSPTPDVDSIVEVVEDEPEDLFFWWSYDYTSYRQLTVRNNEGSEPLQQGKWVTLNINHKKLVDEGKALSTGDDLRIVHLNESNVYTELEINLENPNTTFSSISFKLIKEITPAGNDNNYFLYYGNPLATKYTQTLEDFSEADSDYIVSYSKEKSPKLSGTVSRKWVLKDDPDPREFKFSVNADLEDLSGTPNISYEVVGTNRKGAMKLIADGNYEAVLNVKDLIPGTYYVQAATKLENLDLKSQKVQFYVSYPLYVSWTQDWEGYDVSDNFLRDMEEISSRHGAPITHFFNPRIYIAGDVPANRRTRLTQWVIDRKNNNGDEIALHLHMHYDLVRAAGVTPKTSPAWGGRENGHDVLTSSYSYAEMIKILAWSREQFQKNGLGNPSSFRAGGWFAGTETLRALQDTGFTLDSSGRTAYDWGTNKVRGPWSLSTTTKPYRPSASNQNINNPLDELSIWEFPNNGADSWTYNTTDLIERFKDNYKNKPLEQKQIVTYLSHPHWFNVDKPKIDETLRYIDNYLYSEDKGPVKYVTLEQAEMVWETYP